MPVKTFKRHVIRPGPYGVMTLPHNWFGDKNTAFDSDEWVGWIEE